MNSEALAEAAAAAKGRIVPFGKYLLLQRVSVGGMAEVFKALPEGAQRIDQIVAVKRILPNIAEDHEFIGMFIDEARLAGQLNHPNICRIYELGRVGDDHYIAMQFLWGRDLLKVINRFKKAGVPMPPPMAAFIAAKACAALHYAHFKRDATGQPLNIIHRDVSPQNVIVGYSGQVKLIDFGVARAASQSQKTQAGILKGKFGYMSPEMIRGLPIDHRSDVFAMGICIHEALTGTRLFYGETDFATLEQVRDANVLPPSVKAPAIPPELDAIVLKALAREVEDRYQSAEALQRALEDMLAALYPGFDEADVGAVMRQAFSYEVAREKQRLAVFSDMLQEGKLVRGAALPALSTEALSTSGEQAAAGHGGAAASSEPVTKRSQLTQAQIEELSRDDDLHDEKTQIFFSADELDEIREIESEPDALLALPESERKPQISDVIMRGGAWSPSHVQRPTPELPSTRPSTPPSRHVSSSGTYQRIGGPDGHDLYAEITNPRDVPTMTLPVFHAAEVTSEALLRAPTRRTQMALLALLSAALVAFGYVVAKAVQTKTGTLEIAAVGAAGALVRVDGVVRGNPPVRVQDLEPGAHTIQIEAQGYELAERKIHLDAGEVIPVSLVLEREKPKPRLLPIAPVIEPKHVVPTTEALRQPRAPANGRDREPRRVKERDESAKDEAGAATVDPAVSATPEGPAAETTQGELLISTLPWSHVFIDDVDTGRDTPVRALKVEAGPHRVGLRTPDGAMHTVDVFVEPGATVRIIRRF